MEFTNQFLARNESVHRLHQGLCQHFQQDPGSAVRLHIEGHSDILVVYPSGTLSMSGIFTKPENLITRYGLGKDTTVEQLIAFIEAKGSLLLRLKTPGVVICHDTQQTL